MPATRMLPPLTRAPGMRSLIRLKQRSSVDFPQPEGPMKAVISRDGMSRVTSWITCFSPYWKRRFSTEMAGIAADGESLTI